MKHMLIHASLLWRCCFLLDANGPNVCARQSSSEFQILECCPNYYEKSDICIECLPGTYGKNCEENCLPGSYGRACGQMCNCNSHQYCDPVRGCVCISGYTGQNCASVCQAGYYGENCQQECNCANKADCHPMNGHCLCPAGWIGSYCTDRCANGKYGVNCSKTCDCQAGILCDPVKGECFNNDYDEEAGDNENRVCPDMLYLNKGNGNCSGVCLCKEEHYYCKPESGKCECAANATHCPNAKWYSHGTISRETIISISVPTAAGLFVILIIIFIAMLVRRRNRQQSVQRTETNSQDGYDEINPYDEIPIERLNNQTTVFAQQSILPFNFPLMRKEGNKARSLPTIDTAGLVTGYLQPYVTLNAERNDYLTPYSAIRHGKRPQRNLSKSCGNLSTQCRENVRKSF